jgi:Ser/Thr protein kinase RdoA (MazF antagonist)
MESKLSNIFSQFQIKEKPINVFPFGSGHINDTFKIETEGMNYLLQRINHSIFKDVEGLTDNFLKVTEHIREKLNSSNTTMQTLKLYPDQSGSYFLRDEEGNYWRLLDFIEDSSSYDLVENKTIAYEGGKAYGQFVKMLSDFPAEILVETIPQFHDINFRLANFRKAVKNDSAKRVAESKAEIDFIEARAEEMKQIIRLGEKGKIPLRVTHNDTKINNVLFNKAGKGICVIDLDTVMPGYIHYDFGDSIRTFTNTADEDEADLTKVGMDPDYYAAFTKGFLEKTRAILTEEELNTLAFSAKLMTYIIGLRFFTDYLEGDVYYKTKYPEHNLTRAKTQFKLLESMEEQFSFMQDCIA